MEEKIYVSRYVGHHLMEKSLPGMSSWGGAVKPALWEGARLTLSIHKAMPCREGAALFSPPAHTPAVHHNTLSPEWGGSCWFCHCRTKEELGNKKEFSAGGADHHMVNPAEHLIPSPYLIPPLNTMCLFKPHTYFSDFKEEKDSYFLKQQYFSHCCFYFHQWTIGNGGVSC